MTLDVPGRREFNSLLADRFEEPDFTNLSYEARQMALLGYLIADDTGDIPTQGLLDLYAIMILTGARIHWWREPDLTIIEWQEHRKGAEQ